MSLETIDFDRLNIRPGDRLLDLGCGEGRHSISAHLRSDADIIGLDLGQLALRTAKGRLGDFPFAANKAGTCSFIQGTGHSLSFANATATRRSRQRVVISLVLVKQNVRSVVVSANKFDFLATRSQAVQTRS